MSSAGEAGRIDQQKSEAFLGKAVTDFGAVAADDALREVVTGAGFKEFRRATETPFNRVSEARR
jgi:hypothetical protein